MDNTSGRIGKIFESIGEAEALLNEYLTPEIEDQMSPDQLKQLTDMRKLTGVDLKNAAKDLERTANKHKR